MSDDQNRDHVQSIERCLAVIEAFTGRAGLSFGELASATGLSKPTVRRILLTLQSLGYARSVDSHFSLTPKVLGLGYAYLSSLNLTEVAHPLMEALTDQLRESTALSALDGIDVVYLNRVHRHRISSMALAVGTRLPAHATSSGHVLLADLMPDALADYFAKAALKKLTDRTLTTKSALVERLKIVRAQGWDIVDQELEIGRISAAAPIRDAAGIVVAALSFSCGTHEHRVEQVQTQFVPMLRRSAEKISAAMGGSGYAPRKNDRNAAHDKLAQVPNRK
jgi:IclR family transcriptional regulator, pca regulon regulatory protein